MRKLIVIAVVLLAAMVAMAQEEKVQVFGGYQFFTASGGGHRTNFPKGWNADLSLKATKHFSVVSDFAGAYKNGGSVHTFMFGPRFSTTSGKVTPFAEALFGGMRATGGGAHFSMAFGGGLDVSVSKRVSVRLAKFDYNYVRVAEGQNLNNFRYATGFVFKF